MFPGLLPFSVRGGGGREGGGTKGGMADIIIDYTFCFDTRFLLECPLG